MRWMRRTRALGYDHAAGWADRSEVGAPVDRPTVVVETEDGAEAVALWHALGREGYHVEWCPGPGGAPKQKCPLATTGRCDLVDGADVVLSDLGFSDDKSRQVAAMLAEKYPGTPVLVAAPAPALARVAGTARVPEPSARHSVLAYPLTTSGVIGAVRQAVRRRRPDAAGVSA